MMMCGILTDTSCLVLPHLIVQGFFLLFSLGYFLFYAWSYFYDDLYVHMRPFKVANIRFLLCVVASADAITDRKDVACRPCPDLGWISNLLIYSRGSM